MRIAALAVVAALAGCATGNNVVKSQLDGLELGKSTRADVEAKLGKPTFDRRTPDGTSSINYVWVDPHTRTASFFLINEGPTAGVDATSRSAGFFFDEKGVLIDMLGRQRVFGTGTDTVSTPTF
jgi:hypothetical protein